MFLSTPMSPWQAKGWPYFKYNKNASLCLPDLVPITVILNTRILFLRLGITFLKTFEAGVLMNLRWGFVSQHNKFSAEVLLYLWKKNWLYRISSALLGWFSTKTDSWGGFVLQWAKVVKNTKLSYNSVQGSQGWYRLWKWRLSLFYIMVYRVGK